MDDFSLSIHVADRDERLAAGYSILNTSGDASIEAAARRAMAVYPDDTAVTVAVSAATNVLTITVTPD
jgi:hypothetical protein